MKKIIFSFIIGFIIFMSFMTNTKALCYDDELNQWALDAQIQFIDFDRYLTNEITGKPLGDTMDYAYILALTPSRDDVVMKATNNYGEELEWVYVPGHKVKGIVNYTVKGTMTYEISVYGSSGSACPNELLKTFDYTLEPFNFHYKTEECEKYPEAPLCQMYKDTSDITDEEFKEVMQEYEEEILENMPPTTFEKIFSAIKEYCLYVIIPFILIAGIYTFRIEKVKREEMEK